MVIGNVLGFLKCLFETERMAATSPQKVPEAGGLVLDFAHVPTRPAALAPLPTENGEPGA